MNTTPPNPPDFEKPRRTVDAKLEQALELLDDEIDVRLSELSERLDIDKDKVIALSLIFFAAQLDMRDSGKMVVVCQRPATAYEDPLAALFGEEPTQKYQEIYEQIVAKR